MFIEVFLFTLEQDGQKSGGAMPPVWKVEGPLAPLPPPPVAPPMAIYASSVQGVRILSLDCFTSSLDVISDKPWLNPSCADVFSFSL